jgi:FkbM family methyltransferase
MESEEKKIIFDFGANRGQNLPYYLDRADLVVAVEANPDLCKEIELKFQKEIEGKRLFVENLVLTDNESQSGSLTNFYLHKTNSVLSQFQEPENKSYFTQVELPQTTPSELVNRYTLGRDLPYYVKVDLEGFDKQVIQNLFNNGIFPTLISAESHSFEVFAALVNSGQYHRYKLVDGLKVTKSCWFSSNGEKIPFSGHSAGPFGNEIAGSWLSPDAFFKFLAYENLGWKDIHCTRNLEPYRTSLSFWYLGKRESWMLTHRTYQAVLPLSIRKYISKVFYKIKSIFK